MSLDIWLKIDVDTGGKEPYSVNLFDSNYTHNCVPMWKKAGIYEALYESEGKTAYEVIETLKKGLQDMKDHPKIYQELNPDNGWGDYESALKWIQELVDTFERHPKGVIGVLA